MKDRKTLRKTTALLLSLCMIFSLASGCSAKKDKTPEPTDSGVYVPSVSTPPTSVVQKGSDSVFSINYRSEEPINPFLLLSQTNKTVSGLIYEGLFSVNQSFEQEKVLCDDYSTEDGVNFSFSIKQDVLFHDGSKLTANDVLYSLETAKASPLYSERLICIDSLSVADDYTLSITLSYSNRSFPLLLDVPVIKYGQAADNMPAGTGPYVLSGTDEYAFLKAFSDWRGYDSLPVSRIYLQEYETEMLASAFETGYVDLVTTDPADSFHIDYGGNNEAWYYDTSIMQYIGFNTNSGFLSRSWARRAISLAVNRDHIAEAFMSGCARVSTIPINPVSGLWNSEINEINAFSLQTMSTLLYENGVEDHDNDGLLEYMVNGVPISFTIDFIVSEENENRLEAARYITATLRNAGFDINLRELSWDEYIKALKNGDFDMFYGETRLTSDFDLSALLSPGGDLNFTGVSDTNCQSLISAFLSAEDLDKSGAADNLYEYLSESSLIAPVLFRQQIVLTRRGAVKGALPTQQNIFNNISEWTIITD